MHSYSLWWKLLGGSSHKAPTIQAKSKSRKHHGTKKKSRKQADCESHVTAPSATSGPGTGAPENGPRELPDSAVLDAGGDGVVRTLLKAVGIRRVKTMTSRSRVCGNPKYKVNNQNLEKFEQFLSKIPEGEKLKGTTSLASLPERHEDSSRASTSSAAPAMPAPSAMPAPPAMPAQPGPPAPPALPERPGPDISPSATMGSSVTAEYELFCKAFHSEAKELLPEDEPPKVCVNSMRQMLQEASEAAARGLQLQRVTSAFGATGSPRDTRIIDETNDDEGTSVPDMVAALVGEQSTTGSTTELTASNPPQPARVPSREHLVEQSYQEAQQDPEPHQHRSQRHSRRWSENPVGAPVFMAKKFAEKVGRSKEVVPPPTVPATAMTRKKSSSSLFKALKPMLPFSSPKSASKQSTPPPKQPSKSGAGGNESTQPSTSLSTPRHQSSQQSSSPKKSKRWL